MDKKNLTIGILLFAAAFALMFYQGRHAPQPAPQPAPAATGDATQPATSAAPAATAAPAPSIGNGGFAQVATENKEARIVSLENEFVQVRFTNYGGAIRDIALKKYAAVQDKPEPFIFNERHIDPMLAITSESLAALGRDVVYELVSQSSTEVVFRAVYENRLEVFRRYVLTPDQTPKDKGDPYVLRHEITVRNLTDQTQALPNFAVSIGTAAPVNAQDVGMHLKTGYKSGDSVDFIARSKLEGGGFMGFGSHPPLPSFPVDLPLKWASVHNQFFAAILTPDQPGRGMVTYRVPNLPKIEGTDRPTIGLAAAMGVDGVTLVPKGEKTMGFSFYAGPKEYPRLSNADIFKNDEDRVMDYGFFRLFSKILITMMNWIHGFVGNWGLAIVFTTLTLKILFVPLTISAAKSAKKMQKLSPLLTALREKHKDNPQKQQQATMELFKEHKVNPLGGCIPILLTIPFFMGFFAMLQSTAELRFASFLWAHDLSLPDTVGHLWGFPINILPIILGATMVIQFRMTPQSPTMDPMQAKIMQFMPYLFTAFCYNLSCALSLYSTVNGLFTIGQQTVINRMKDSDAVAPAVAAPSGRKVKNVTPKK
ncbi:membrane protein insertase YidC [Nibricoccus sp. IMCC34717]|uniref:membrane protein insertase YidC n=1 Tax=Nibricoccus sp. IMCC34717 TaxID=3034021 RepID=UPI00384D72EB